MGWAGEGLETAIVLQVASTIALLGMTVGTIVVLAMTAGVARLARQLATGLRGMVGSELPPARLEP
jgi:hypothetical protein